MLYIKNIFLKSKHILVYGAAMAVLVFLLKWLQWKFLILDNSVDLYVGIISVFFTILGTWIAMQLVKPKVEKVIVEKEVYIQWPDTCINEVELNKLNLSEREYEVLQLITLGKSNAEIAHDLFLSLSTIKKHVSNVMVKMDVKSRTQIMEKAKRLKITL